MKRSKEGKVVTRRGVIAAFAATTLFPAPAVWAQSTATEGTRRNVSSFRVAKWQDHFDTLKNGVILSDTQSKVLQYWSEDESVYRMYPTSVPLTEDLTRLGYTTVTRKVEGPSWRPTPAMKERNPAWPDYVGPGPEI